MNMISGISSVQRYIPATAARHLHEATKDIAPQRRFQRQNMNGWEKSPVKPQTHRQSLKQPWSQKLGQTAPAKNMNGIRFSQTLTTQTNANAPVTSQVIGFIPQNRGVRPTLLYTDNVKRHQKETPQTDRISPAKQFAILRANTEAPKKQIDTPTDLLKALMMLLRKGEQDELTPKNKSNISKIKKIIPQIIEQGQFKGGAITVKDRNNLIKAQRFLENKTFNTT